MPYRLRVTAGPSLDLSTHNLIQVNNDDSPLEIQSPHFNGRIVVRVKEFSGVTDNGLPRDGAGDYRTSMYFDNKTATFSLQCQGQYGDPTGNDNLTADDILFGIVLRESLNDTPALSRHLIERTMRFFWPLMECDLHNPSPWVLSPMFATMSRIQARTGIAGREELDSQKYFRQAQRSRPELPPWPGIMTDAESESVTPFLRARCGSRASSVPRSPNQNMSPPAHRSIFRPFSYLTRAHSFPPDAPLRTPKERKSHFASPIVRKQVRIEPTDVITTDFRNSFIDFRDLSLAVPGVPFRIDLARHMVGRPTQYVCRSRTGVVFWAIVFTILEDNS